LNYKLKNKIDDISRTSNCDSTMHSLQMNFKRFCRKAKGLNITRVYCWWHR